MNRKLIGGFVLVVVGLALGCSGSSSSNVDPAAVEKIRQEVSANKGIGLSAEGQEVTKGDIQVPPDQSPPPKAK